MRGDRRANARPHSPERRAHARVPGKYNDAVNAAYTAIRQTEFQVSRANAYKELSLKK